MPVGVVRREQVLPCTSLETGSCNVSDSLTSAPPTRRSILSRALRVARLALSAALLTFVGGAVVYKIRYEPLPLDIEAQRVVVEKSRRRLSLVHREGHVLKTYRVALGRSPVGPKTRDGDGKTPEGMYRVDRRNPHGPHHLALYVSYPDAEDRERAERLGVPPGGNIAIHGLPEGFGFLGPLHRLVDWTQGGIAVTDAEIEEIWRAVPDGAPVDIRP
jgi:hypothetical protein